MVSTRVKGIAIVVGFLGVSQIFFEDLMVFLGATSSGPTGILNHPYVAIGFPLAVSLLLIVILIGGAIFYADDFR